MSKWLCPAAIVIIILFLAAAINFSWIQFPDNNNDEKEDDNGGGDDGGNGNNDYDPDKYYYRPYPVSAEFEYQRTVVISAKGTMTYTLNLPAPMDVYNGSEILQDIKSIQPSKTPIDGTTSTERTTNNMMVFKDTVNDNKVTISVKYTMKTNTLVLDRAYYKENSGTVDNIEQTWKDTYNKDSWRIDLDLDGILDPEDDIDGDGEWDFRIEPSNKDIQTLASRLTEGKDTVYEKLLSFYEFLISDEMMNYNAAGSALPKSCTQTLGDKTGDCDDYSILFISLCRAAGIPARLNFGAMYIKDRGEWNSHGWAEVYLPLKDGGHVLGTVDVVSEQFMIRDALHVATWIDTGGDMTIDGNTENNLDHYTYLFTYSGSGNLESDTLSSISFTSSGVINVELTKAEVTNNNR